MGFNSMFKALKLLKTPGRAFKQFKWPRPQCVKSYSRPCHFTSGVHWTGSSARPRTSL